MIKKIAVQNFFSFGAEQTIELNADTNILVGINGTGKSNFIKAIRLLQEGIKGDFEKLFSQKWGGFRGCGVTAKSEGLMIAEILKVVEMASESVKVLVGWCANFTRGTLK